MGISLAPISGKLVATWVDGKNAEVDASALAPDRFN